MGRIFADTRQLRRAAKDRDRYAGELERLAGTLLQGMPPMPARADGPVRDRLSAAAKQLRSMSNKVESQASVMKTTAREFERTGEDTNYGRTLEKLDRAGMLGAYFRELNKHRESHGKQSWKKEVGEVLLATLLQASDTKFAYYLRHLNVELYREYKNGWRRVGRGNSMRVRREWLLQRLGRGSMNRLEFRGTVVVRGGRGTPYPRGGNVRLVSGGAFVVLGGALAYGGQRQNDRYNLQITDEERTRRAAGAAGVSIGASLAVAGGCALAGSAVPVAGTLALGAGCFVGSVAAGYGAGRAYEEAIN